MNMKFRSLLLLMSNYKHLFSVLFPIMIILCGGAVLADTAYLPEVVEEMTVPSYWIQKVHEPNRPLSDLAEIGTLNRAFLSAPDCHMTDLKKDYPSYDGKAFQSSLADSARERISRYSGYENYGWDGRKLIAEDYAGIAESIQDAEVLDIQTVQYGIATMLADVRSLPTYMLATDDPADLDFDFLQLATVRVNEPVVIRGKTADGLWFFCDTLMVPGWIKAEQIAVCASREEWLNAWDIPAEEIVVVTDSKIFLDQANVNRASSGRMLTMGTTLRKVREADYNPAVTNRALYHNIAVQLPVRDEEGRYTTTIALIPKRAGVSEGYLTLTTENILTIAFNALGDAYGWGGMLAVPDCSGYIRNIYKCFGLELPRNTTWQSAMPAFKKDFTGLDLIQRQGLLDELVPGTILFYPGHEMLYLGTENGLHYVVSASGSIVKPDGETKLRTRSVIINTLEETFRLGGNSWLEDLKTAVIPYLPEAVAPEAEQSDAA